MGFLAPVFLVAAGAAAIPFLLHLFHRHDPRRVAFPALRYLQRTEKEAARRIRFRQLLLLVLRVSVILLLVLAGARLWVRGSGTGHDPTAVVLLLDNSMSSGLVLGEERVLDRLKRLAARTAELATPDDRLWVIRVGEPWDVAPPGGPQEALERILDTEPTTAAADLSAALARARDLLLTTGHRAREIHLLSDGQATAFRQTEGEPPAGDLPVLVFAPREAPPTNRYLSEVMVGGGLSPLAGQRTEIAVTVGTTDLEEAGEVPLRLVIDDRVRGAASSLPGRTVVLPVGPFPEGLVQGWVEMDPDDLRADDRRPFAFRVRPPPRVARLGGEGFFLEQALSVLEDAGRVRRSAATDADVVFSEGGDGLESRREGQALVVFPPGDPTLLPALNLRLAQSGVPWRVERPTGVGGEASPGESRMPVDLEGVRVPGRYALLGAEDDPAADVLVRLSTGEPWIVSGTTAAGPYLLFGSPMDAQATTLPVSAAALPLLEWVTSHWYAPGTAIRRLDAGQPLAVEPSATHVLAPEGRLHPVDGTSVFRETREAGVYAVLRGDTVLEHLAVGAPVRESLLARLDQSELPQRVGPNVRVVQEEADWPAAVFVSRQGRELWWPLLALAVLLLLLEGWVAAPGRAARRAEGGAAQEVGRNPDGGRRERATVA